MNRLTRIFLAVCILWTALHLTLWGLKVYGYSPGRRGRSALFTTTSLSGTLWEEPRRPTQGTPARHDFAPCIAWIAPAWGLFGAYYVIFGAGKKPDEGAKQ